MECKIDISSCPTVWGMKCADHHLEVLGSNQVWVDLRVCSTPVVREPKISIVSASVYLFSEITVEVPDDSVVKTGISGTCCVGLMSCQEHVMYCSQWNYTPQVLLDQSSNPWPLEYVQNIVHEHRTFPWWAAHRNHWAIRDRFQLALSRH